MLPRVIVACDDGVVIGYGSWRLYGSTMHIVNIAVDRGYRSHGVGRALMGRMRAIAIQARCTRWFLNVKKDNTPARRLYEACGMAVMRESWAMTIDWAAARGLPTELADAAPLDDADVDQAAARFRQHRERLATMTSRPGYITTVLRQAGDLVGLAAFDPSFPGAYPFCVARPALCGALLSALALHADPKFDFVRVTIEDDRPLVDTLVGAGATVTFEILQLAADLV